LTHGRGSFASELASYEEVPAHVAQKVIEAHKKEAESAGH
jgi:elongation factor G